MDPDLILIFGFVLMILIVALSAGMRIHRRSNEHEERKLELLARRAEAEAGAGATGEAYKLLEERVRVLERIATDSSEPLAMQIEQLRDLQSIDTELSTKEKTQ